MRIYGYNNRLFKEVDVNQDELLSPTELRAMITGINLEEITFDADDVVGKIMKEFDISNDSNVDLEEFKRGMSNWLNKTKPSIKKNNPYSETMELEVSSHWHRVCIIPTYTFPI